ncbi:hypothetical protein [Acidithiobacillus ferridurans]|uniref:hypothetical protein n=1 Tax=Acidithiobacillus ferridurans TaxID=1232575 RepID=UPI001C06F780|nr:hypothetical protein [Acidithiobacillus ferridurans]
MAEVSAAYSRAGYGDEQLVRRPLNMSKSCGACCRVYSSTSCRIAPTAPGRISSGWAKKNILIAVASGATDGTSGVREAADQTIRREIEGFAHVIFAGSPAQR